MSLRTRLILSYILIIVLCLSIVAAALFVLLQEYRDRQAMARLKDMTVPIYIQVKSLARGQASLDEVVANVQEQAEETGTYIFLLDDEGKIIRQATPEGKELDYSPELPIGEIPTDMSKPYRGSYTTPEGQRFIFVAYPITGLFQRWNTASPQTLVLAVPRSYALALWVGLTKPLLWAGLIAFAVSIVIAIFLARSVYLPIRRVTNAADEIAQGKYEQQIPVTGPKEVKGLALRFNQMAQQVNQSRQTLRDFVADVSHELRTPLTSIRGFAQAILDGTAKDKESQLKAAGVIDDESKRVIRLVDELLELSRMESGQIQITHEPVDMKELLHHCQEIFAMQAEEKGMQLRVDVEPLPPVVGDIDRLEQVFSNLLDNALKHTPAGGKVTVTAHQSSADFIEITVADTGPGISPDQLPHVFQRFYRADSSGTKVGTGLGLAIAREIVRTHGGDIEVDSTPGEGTNFAVTLPLNPNITP